MSLEAIKTIGEAEEQAKKIKADAAAEAKRMIGESETAGKAEIAAAEAKAANELAELTAKADEKALISAKELAKSSEAEQTAMRSAAESKIDKAVSLIVERIVYS